MTIFGSDVSHFDAPDTRAMFGEGIVFQTHKAGGDRNDPELAEWWNHVKDMELPPSGRAGSTGPTKPLLGAYWVLYPGRPLQRADEFIARLDAQCPGWRDGPFILQADCEKWNGDPTTVPPVSDVNAFCDRLVARMPKLRPIGYLPDWVYGDISRFRYPLWSSKYVRGSGPYQSLYPGDNAKQWGAYGGKEPDILQYTSSATIGGQTTCDANAFCGTLDQLIKLLAPGWAGAEEDVMSAQEVVDGNKEYNKVTQSADANYPGGMFNGNEGGKNVWDRQDIPIPSLNKKGPAWQALEALQKDTMALATTLVDLNAKVDRLTALLEAHVAGLIEGP